MVKAVVAPAAGGKKAGLKKASITKGKPAKADAVEKEEEKSSVNGHHASAEEPARMDVGLFYAFGQCSLRMEAREHMGRDFELKDPEAKKLWPAYEQLAKRGLGKSEKWVPWHTVLGVHEFFLINEVHYAKVPWWKDYNRFVAMFIFRCHCKRELFSEVQMPHLKRKEFWNDLQAGFAPGSKMEEELLAFRRQGHALQTGCFLIIPERILEDDNENLARNIVIRSQRLVELAKDLWPIVQQKKTSAHEKFELISKAIGNVKTLGDTWVKMLMVCIDICLPKLGLLHERCEVGIGAADPMRKLLEDEGLISPKVKAKREGQTIAIVIDGVSVIPSLRSGVVAVRRDGKQLIQVTKGMAGTIDRATAIAQELAKVAVACSYGPEHQEELKVKRQALFDNANLKVPNLGLDAKAEDLPPPIERRPSDEPTPSEALSTLCKRINGTEGASAKHFWTLLAEVEAHARVHFKQLGLVVAQMRTRPRNLSAVTLQVQLCEFRQLQNFLQRSSLKRPAGT